MNIFLYFYIPYFSIYGKRIERMIGKSAFFCAFIYSYNVVSLINYLKHLFFRQCSVPFFIPAIIYGISVLILSKILDKQILVNYNEIARLSSRIPFAISVIYVVIHFQLSIVLVLGSLKYAVFKM